MCSRCDPLLTCCGACSDLPSALLARLAFPGPKGFTGTPGDAFLCLFVQLSYACCNVMQSHSVLLLGDESWGSQLTLLQVCEMVRCL